MSGNFVKSAVLQKHICAGLTACGKLSRHTRMKQLIVWIVVLAALAGGGWWAWKNHPEKFAFLSAAQPEVKKSSRPTTAQVVARDISFAVYAAGDIGPAEQVSVRPEVSGKIDKLPVDIGDKAKKDALLFTLDDSDLQTERSSHVTEIDAAKLQIEAAQLQLEKNRLNFERTKQLYDSKLLAQEVFDNTKADFDLSRNNLAQSKNNLERAQKALQAVEDKISKTKILAPFDCTILTRPVSVGQAVSGASGVNSGTEVLTIANLGDMIITAHINQADVVRLRVGQKVDVEVEAIPGLKFAGIVDRVAPQATIRNGIKGYTTRIMLKNADQAVRPGMTANLTIPLANADNVLAVPLAAVFTDQGERYIYVKKEEKFVRTPVKVGVSDYDFAEITSGLEGGETVSLVVPAEEIGKVQQLFGQKGPAGAKNPNTTKSGKSGKSGVGGPPGGKSSVAGP